MDDFSVFGPSCDACLEHLTQILDVCVKKHLVLSWEKSHFIVREGIVFGHLVSSKGFEVDKAKVEVIQDLALPTSIRELRSFLGHVGFYRRFIKDFATVSKPLTSLLCKEKDFIIEEEGKHAFMQLKQALVEAPILQSPNWDLWWRTTPVATKTRYHGVGGALLRARIYPLIFTSLFLYYGPFDPHVFKRVLVYFFSPFRLPGGFFPFRDPICEAHPSL